MLVGPAEGETGFKRVDMTVKPMSGGGLYIDVELPDTLPSGDAGSSPRWA
jgi:hypothetical protein